MQPRTPKSTVPMGLPAQVCVKLPERIEFQQYSNIGCRSRSTHLQAVQDTLRRRVRHARPAHAVQVDQLDGARVLADGLVHHFLHADTMRSSDLVAETRIPHKMACWSIHRVTWMGNAILRTGLSSSYCAHGNASAPSARCRSRRRTVLGDFIAACKRTVAAMASAAFTITPCAISNEPHIVEWSFRNRREAGS